MEVPLLSRRLSTPRAATAVAIAAVLAAAIAVTPSFAGSSFLTSQKAAHLYLTNKKASGLFLKKKAAGNTFVKKATAPLTPTAAIAASNTVFGPVAATTAGYIPTAFASFSTKGVAPAVITFSGQATCTAPTAGLACPVSILVDGQAAAKVNFALSTVTGSTAAVPAVHTVTATTVLGKGGHTVAIQYAGTPTKNGAAPTGAFTLQSWNLAVQAYPQLPETPVTTEPSKGNGK
jgi:hypothetical protein